MCFFDLRAALLFCCCLSRLVVAMTLARTAPTSTPSPPPAAARPPPHAHAPSTRIIAYNTGPPSYTVATHSTLANSHNSDH